MKKPCLLIVSNVRPSRTWNFANRIVREVPGAEISGIVQYPLGSIPLVQQRIAAGEIRMPVASAGWLPKVLLLLHSALEKIADWVLWFTHGCPIDRGTPKKFTVERLSQECARAGWPFIVTSDDYDDPSVHQTSANLIVFLGEVPSLRRLPVSSSSGCIRASVRESANGSNGTHPGAAISVEHFTRNSKASSPIASVTLPWQPYDGLLGFTLKTDLIVDDLLLQTAASLLVGNPESAPSVVQSWTDRILSPCLKQLAQVKTNHADQRVLGYKRCRSSWKLCLDTLLLCSPWNLGRNWYRRWSGKYPALILTHHLVSDRPHRMAVATEVFWKQILFLQRHYRMVSLSEAAKLVSGGKIRVPTVALTFDDGYADNFLSLRAVASEAGIPATLFITTEPLLTQREFEHDRLNGITGFLPLTWDQVRYWNARGAEFGSHTRTHFDCGSSALEALKSEIVGSRKDIESQLGTPVNVFAFPYGKPQNMSLEAMNLAESTYSHFVSFFGGEGCAENNGNHSHLLRKRFYSNRWELELELQSVFDQVETIKRLFQSRKEERAAPALFRVPAVPALTSPMQGVKAPSVPAGVYSHIKNP